VRIAGKRKKRGKGEGMGRSEGGLERGERVTYTLLVHTSKETTSKKDRKKKRERGRCFRSNISFYLFLLS